MRRGSYPLAGWLADTDVRANIRHDLTKAYGPTWRLSDFLQGGDLGDLLTLELSYSSTAGESRLRAAIARFLSVDPERVTVTNGASEAIQLALLDVAGDGGTILMPEPAYPAFKPMARAVGLDIVNYPLRREESYWIGCDAILGHVRETTRMVIVNSPHNPTGAVMAMEEATALAQALEERRVQLLIDEVFWPISTVTSSHAKSVESAIVVGDLSKAFSMPGLRIGWMVMPDHDAHLRARERRSWLSTGTSPILEQVAVPVLDAAERFIGRTQKAVLANRRRSMNSLALVRAASRWYRQPAGLSRFHGLVCLTRNPSAASLRGMASSRLLAMSSAMRGTCE